MNWPWMVGWGMVGAVLTWALIRLVERWLRARRVRRVTVDLMLDDLAPPEPKPTRLGYNDETAPAISSLPPEIDRSEWEAAPPWDAPDQPPLTPRRPSPQRWLH